MFVIIVIVINSSYDFSTRLWSCWKQGQVLLIPVSSVQGMAKGWQWPPEARERQEGVPPGVLEGVWPCQHPHFGRLVSQAVKQNNLQYGVTAALTDNRRAFMYIYFIPYLVQYCFFYCTNFFQLWPLGALSDWFLYLLDMLPSFWLLPYFLILQDAPAYLVFPCLQPRSSCFWKRLFPGIGEWYLETKI